MRARVYGVWLMVLCGGVVVAAAPADDGAPRGMAGRLIAHFHMQRIPEEGPWFALQYLNEDTLAGESLPPRYAGRAHRAGSAIVLVETTRDFSALHRLRTDEVWHFYGGVPLELLLLYPDGHGRKVTLGKDVLGGQFPQFTVPHDVWQASSPLRDSPAAYSLAGDQLSPAFDDADFEMGYRDELEAAYPAYARDIARFTRSGYVHRPAARARDAAAGAVTAPRAVASRSGDNN